MAVKTVFTIPPDVPFLKTLASNILNGNLLPEDFDLSNPLALASVTIYLPTRRSCRLLEETFFDLSGKQSIILPDIRALGDVDENELLDEEQQDFKGLNLEIPPALSPIERQLILTRLIMEWGKAQARASLPTKESEQPLLVPASSADAAWLASDLAELMDRATTEEISWQGLSKLVPDDYAAFWQLSLTFLKIVTNLWPDILNERGMVDGAKRRDMLIDEEARRLQFLKGPVIAAGSTGTLPSTARFLIEVATLEKGALILPGFDETMDETTYKSLGGPENRQEAISGHPQYGLKQLIHHHLKILPKDILSLGSRDDALKVRINCVSTAMLPAPSTHNWPVFRKRLSDQNLEAAFSKISLIDAKDDAEEALAIACALREFIEKNEGQACLVTPDRAFARRVALELQRWGLKIDDSAGRPLVKTAPAILSQLLLDCVAEESNPVLLLSLLKHPLARFGMEAGHVRRAARILDLAILRGPRLKGGMKALSKRFEKIKTDILSGTAQAGKIFESVEKAARPERIHPSVSAYSVEDWHLAGTLIEKLVEVLSPLETLFETNEALLLSKLADCHEEAFYKIITDETGIHENGTAISALSQRFEAMKRAEGDAFSILPPHYPETFRALLGAGTVREKALEDERILILGALEARLLAPDLMILSGLDEGSWPMAAKSDAFMSRGMRASLGMEAPERRISLAAHDVCQGLGNKNVILSRAGKRGGSPTVMSRWLQRLLALLGEDIKKDIIERGSRYRAYAKLLDRDREKPQVKIERPNPKPPLSARPKALSITRIETWVRDPYAIYADRVLNLKPVEPIGRLPDNASWGTLVHDVLDRINSQTLSLFEEGAEQHFFRLAKTLLEEDLKDFPDIKALWWPRIKAIIPAYLAWEKTRPDVLKRHSELAARLDLPVDGENFALSGRIDRIDELSDDSLAILDFKTGTVPSAKVVKSGLNAQLALEVTMQQKGSFDALGDFSKRFVSELGWVKIDGLTPKVPFTSAFSKRDEDIKSPDDLGLLAEKQLVALIRQYRNEAQGYLSRPRPDFKFSYVGDYDHLARVREWELFEGEDEA